MLCLTVSELSRILVGFCLAAAMVLSGCGGDGEEDVGDLRAERALAGQLTSAAGKTAGTCLASEAFGIALSYEERQIMRADLRLLAKAEEINPDMLSSDGQTVTELLFDLIPTLKKCDPSMGLEAEVAVED
jgi:hypothetical protein